MKTVAVTEAKNHLSACIQAVQQGDTVLIMSRRKPVARLEPVHAGLLGPGEERLVQLEQDGLLRRATAGVPALVVDTPPPAPRDEVSVVEALVAERRDER